MLRGDRIAESDSCSILAREKTRDYLQQTWLEDPLQPIRESEGKVPAPTGATIRVLSLKQKQWAHRNLHIDGIEHVVKQARTNSNWSPKEIHGSPTVSQPVILALCCIVR